jgi:hypothetical protein
MRAALVGMRSFATMFRIKTEDLRFTLINTGFF